MVPPDELEALRSRITRAIEDGTRLIADLKGLSAAFPALVESLEELTEIERDERVATICGYDPEIAARLRGLVESLAAEGIYVAPRLGRMRISPHVYNDEADADRFVAALAWRLRA